MDTSGSFKHFSHAHNLVIHHTNEAAKMICDGCDLLVIGTTYICWQCNFMLHEQCFHATRSLTHPSHPSHPLTLVPYPTYPSNSFYCDSCKLTGKGLSYSCSDCEFDLHVHCAHSVSNASHGQHMVPQSGHNSYQPQNVYPPPTSVAQNPVEIPAADRERLRKNEQRLEIAREEYRIAALGRQYALDNI